MLTAWTILYALALASRCGGLLRNRLPWWWRTSGFFSLDIPSSNSPRSELFRWITSAAAASWRTSARWPFGASWPHWRSIGKPKYWFCLWADRIRRPDFGMLAGGFLETRHDATGVYVADGEGFDHPHVVAVLLGCADVPGVLPVGVQGVAEDERIDHLRSSPRSRPVLPAW